MVILLYQNRKIRMFVEHEGLRLERQEFEGESFDIGEIHY